MPKPVGGSLQESQIELYRFSKKKKKASSFKISYEKIPIFLSHAASFGTFFDAVNI